MRIGSVVHTKNNPLVSVIMPMYNAEQYVLTALSSVLREQAIPIEVIVINDGSTDSSCDRVNKLADERICLLDNWGKGIAEALNTGLAVARGQYIVRCDADDRYPAHRITQQISWLEQHPEYGAICGGYAAMDPKGAPLVQFGDKELAGEITQELAAGYVRTHFCTYALRTEIVRSLGGFRPYFTTAEDIDLQLRLGEVCRVWYKPGVHYHYRLHKTSITHTKSSIEREFFDRIAREFQIQRQATGLDDLQRGTPIVPPKAPTSPPLTAAQHIQKFLLWRAWCEHQAGQKRQALATGLQSALAFPRNLAVWRSVVALAVKPVKPDKSIQADKPVQSDKPVQADKSDKFVQSDRLAIKQTSHS